MKRIISLIMIPIFLFGCAPVTQQTVKQTNYQQTANQRQRADIDKLTQKNSLEYRILELEHERKKLEKEIDHLKLQRSDLKYNELLDKNVNDMTDREYEFAKFLMENNSKQTIADAEMIHAKKNIGHWLKPVIAVTTVILSIAVIDEYVNDDD